ncbi:MAG: PDZ domain-containing protein [Clostridia bacterium]|nr:PDZ domain-containing protein [Clostridia bacterium]
MKKKISVSTSLVLILFAVLLTFQITYTSVEKEYQSKVDVLTQKQSDFSDLVGVDQLVRENFNGVVDENALEEGLVRGYLSSLSDRYSKYLTREEYRNFLADQDRIGVGVGARFAHDEKSGEVVIYSVFPASPAEQSGLRKGDVLLRVNGQNVAELGFYNAVAALSGEAGTTVPVTVERTVAAQKLRLDFNVTRREVREATVSYEILPEKVGYIQIFEINEATAEDFGSAIDFVTSSEVSCILFDLRNASGDSLDSVAAMLDRFLSDLVLFRETDREGNTAERIGTPGEISLPITILMNSATCGAPELFAAAMRDYNSAVLVGETTYGKACLQTVVELDDGGALILTNSSYAPPVSDSYEGVGLVPDVESHADQENIYVLDKTEDPQIKAAIAALWN